MVTETATTSAPADLDPWSPCRRHLMDLLFAVPVRLRERAHWRTTAAIWERIRKDHLMASNWADDRRAPHVAVHWLFDIPVHLNGVGDAIELIIPADCRPEG